ncbi:MAG: hypothetical protein ACOYN0_19105, partial [Phycisphaerales bacterium]
DVGFHWRRGVNSVNALTHIHTSKVPIAMVLEAVGSRELMTRFDTGAAFLGAVPRWLGVVIGACFVGALGVAAWYGPRWSRRGMAEFVVVGLSLSSVVKCVLDGGPLAYDAVVGVAALGAMLAPGPRARLVWGAGVPAVWIAVLFAVAPGAVDQQVFEAIKRGSLYAAVWFAPAAIGVCVTRARVVAVVAGATWCACVALDLRTRLLPLLGPGPTRVVTYGADRSATAHEVSEPNVAAAYFDAHENPLRSRRVSLAPRPGVATGIYGEIVLLGLNAGTFAFPRDPVVKFARAEPTERNGHARLMAQIEFDAELGPVLYNGGRGGQVAENERFAAYYLLDSYMREAGVEEYVLLPYYQYADRPMASAGGD